MKSIRRGSVATVGNFDVEINKSEVIFSTHGLPIIEINGNIVGKASGRKIERVIFNDPATVVMWNDGTKTVVKCQDGDTYDKQTGLLMCIAKKHFGNAGSFNDVLHEWVSCEKVGLFDWKSFKAGEIAVLFDSEKAVNDFLKRCGEKGIRWGCGHLASDWKPFHYDYGYAVHCLNDRMYFNTKPDRVPKQYGCEIIEWKVK